MGVCNKISGPTYFTHVERIPNEYGMRPRNAAQLLTLFGKKSHAIYGWDESKESNNMYKYVAEQKEMK